MNDEIPVYVVHGDPEGELLDGTDQRKHDAAVERSLTALGLNGRLPRVKGSGDHNWEPWSQATLGRGRICLDCGCEDDGYQQPCDVAEVVEVVEAKDESDAMNCCCNREPPGTRCRPCQLKRHRQCTELPLLERLEQRLMNKEEAVKLIVNYAFKGLSETTGDYDTDVDELNQAFLAIGIKTEDEVY